MRFFTIHERPARSGSDVIAVPDGFSWAAAIFPLLWLLWHRLWLGLALYIVFAVLLGLALDLGGIADPAALVIGLGTSFLIGCMAGDYRRWTYTRQGWQPRGTVIAGDAAEAEDRYLRARGAARPRPAGMAPAVPHGHAEAFPRLV